MLCRRKSLHCPVMSSSALLPFCNEPGVYEDIHGIAVSDPFRWLEEQNSSQTRDWLKYQQGLTSNYFSVHNETLHARRRLSELMTGTEIDDIWQIGAECFYRKRSRGEEQASIVCRTSHGQEVTLIQPSTSGTALELLAVSDHGEVLAYGIRETGTDLQTVRFFDVARNQPLPERFPAGRGVIIFFPDASGFYYCWQARSDEAPVVLRHRFGASLRQDEEVFRARSNLAIALFREFLGKRIGVVTYSRADEREAECHVIDDPKSHPRCICRVRASVFVPFFAGGSIFALTNQGARNRRIISLDPKSSLVTMDWQEVVSEAEDEILEFAVAANTIFLRYLHDLQTYVRIVSLSGEPKGFVPVPPFGTVKFFNRWTNPDWLLYSYSALDQAPTIYGFDPSTGNHFNWWKADHNLASIAFKQEQVVFKSKDGTDVPMVLAARCDGAPGPRPTFSTAYGGFGACLTPRFGFYSAYLLELGFLFACPYIRGGGELGQNWHQAGKRGNRERSFEDFISAAEYVISRKLANPQKICIGGGSNGGLLMGAALTARPDLFRAVVAVGPIMDMIRYHLFDNAAEFSEEFGTSENADDFKHLFAYSPYHRVHDGTAYPAVLLISGDADTRCNPMHARKMIARLQQATTSGRPILLDYSETWGHVQTQPLSLRIEALARRMTFVCREAGVSQCHN